MTPVDGYAVVVGGQISARTVSPSRRAAIVNYLVVHARLLITSRTTDTEIDWMWQQRRDVNAELIEVTINPKGTT